MSIDKFPITVDIPLDTVATTLISVDSTTQQVLFTGVGLINFVIISNPSNNRALWIKPNDDTSIKQGILIPPQDRIFFPVKSNLTIFGIMDAGGAIDISVVEFT